MLSKDDQFRKELCEIVLNEAIPDDPEILNKKCQEASAELAALINAHKENNPNEN